MKRNMTVMESSLLLSCLVLNQCPKVPKVRPSDNVNLPRGCTTSQPDTNLHVALHQFILTPTVEPTRCLGWGRCCSCKLHLEAKKIAVWHNCISRLSRIFQTKLRMHFVPLTIHTAGSRHGKMFNVFFDFSSHFKARCPSYFGELVPGWWRPLKLLRRKGWTWRTSVCPLFCQSLRWSEEPKTSGTKEAWRL